MRYKIRIMEKETGITAADYLEFITEKAAFEAIEALLSLGKEYAAELIDTKTNTKMIIQEA